MEDLIRRFNWLDYETGFLCASKPPCQRLEDPYYEQWEAALKLLPSLLLACQVRPYIECRFPDLEIKQDTMENPAELGRVFVIFSFLVHGYTRGGLKESIIDTIPLKLAKPFKKSAASLGFVPIVNYSSTVLFNWTTLDPEKTISLDNIRCLDTITGSPDEAWFYLTTGAIEAHGGPVLRLIMQSQGAVDANDISGLKGSLACLAPLIHEMTSTLERMYENNLPQAFYKRVRPYLSGWTNNASMPEGLHYGEREPGEFYSGASAAQSPIFHVLDAALGVVHPAHQPDEEAMAKATRVGMPGSFLKEMRLYMRTEHRDCIEYLEGVLTIRSFVLKNSDVELKEAFNKCVSELEAFRTAHIRMVSLYVVSQAAKESSDIRGTGGSNPIPLLKDLREHVEHAKL